MVLDCQSIPLYFNLHFSPTIPHFHCLFNLFVFLRRQFFCRPIKILPLIASTSFVRAWCSSTISLAWSWAFPQGTRTSSSWFMNMCYFCWTTIKRPILVYRFNYPVFQSAKLRTQNANPPNNICIFFTFTIFDTLQFMSVNFQVIILVLKVWYNVHYVTRFVKI